MNSSDSPKGPIDQLLLDHFVEGELTDAHEREVLLRLDAEPGAWRRLALTFVEAQRWCREFRALAADADGEAWESVRLREPSPTRPLAEERSMRRSRIPLLAIAASGLAAAFLFGLALGGWGHGRPGRSPDVADASEGQAGELSQVVRARAPDGAEESGPAPQASPSPPMLRVAFREAGSEVFQCVDVPVLEASQVPAGLLENPPPAIPVVLKRLLEQSGFEVVDRTQLQPVQLSDGRRFDLVGSETQVRYVGRLVQ